MDFIRLSPVIQINGGKFNPSPFKDGVGCGQNARVFVNTTV
jgi:hypothetical protein